MGTSQSKVRSVLRFDISDSDVTCVFAINFVINFKVVFASFCVILSATFLLFGWKSRYIVNQEILFLMHLFLIILAHKILFKGISLHSGKNIPLPNQIVLRCKFYTRCQESGESIAQFVTDLKKLREGYEFVHLNLQLCDRLVKRN